MILEKYLLILLSLLFLKKRKAKDELRGDFISVDELE